jgi:hypothetical protein
MELFVWCLGLAAALGTVLYFIGFAGPGFKPPAGG